MPEVAVASGCALVAGASSGIGASTAIALARSGVQVIAAARHPERLLDIEAARQVMGSLHPLAADLTDPVAVDRVFAQAESDHGPVQCVVHSVGHAYDVGWFRETRSEDIQDAIAALITSPALVVRRALQSMGPTGGRIGLITSGAAYKPTPGRALYSAAKLGMNRMISSLAAECASEGGKTAIFAISPGRVATPMQQRLVDMAESAPPVFGLRSFLDTSNVSSPRHLGDAIVSLLDIEPSDLNGRVFVYDSGGWRSEHIH